MPRASPRDPKRSFNTRTDGIFKKSTELNEVSNTRIAIFVEQAGSTPLLFTTEEGKLSWPCGIEEFINTHHPVIKRPSDYLTLKQGISGGRALIVESSPPPYSAPKRQKLTHAKERTPELLEPFEAPASTGNSPYYTEASTTGSPCHTDASTIGSPYPMINWMTYSRSMSPHIAGGLGTLPSKRT